VDETWADRAAIDTSPEFERLRRSQSAKTREFLRTLDTFCKVRAAGLGKRSGNAGWRMADGKWQMVAREEHDCRSGDAQGLSAGPS